MDAARKQEFFACLGLKHTPGLGPVTLAKLLCAYDTAVDAVRDARRWPERKITNPKPAQACASGVWRAAAEAEYRTALSWGMQVLLFSDALYPARLRAIADPPILLYAAGDLNLLANPALGVVGARECTPRGLAVTREICAELSAMGLTIASGLALGIDRQAHQGGLAGLGSSIAVLGCGLDRNYPAANNDLRRALEERGLVLTEYAPGIRPQATHFPHRNRIISGLSLGVLVVEAALKSGSLITARLAGEQGRDVFVLAAPEASMPNQSAPNQVFSDQATPNQAAPNHVMPGPAAAHQDADPRAVSNPAWPDQAAPHQAMFHPDQLEWDATKYEGCQKLLDDGAMLVRRAEDILAELRGPLREELERSKERTPKTMDPTRPPDQIPLPGDLLARTRDPLALPVEDGEGGQGVNASFNVSATPSGAASLAGANSSRGAARSGSSGSGSSESGASGSGKLKSGAAGSRKGSAHGRAVPDNRQKQNDNPYDKTDPTDQAVPAETPPDLPPDLPDDEAALLGLLGPDRRPHLDELTRALGWDAPRTSAGLLSLELRGLVRQLPGMRYEQC